MMNGQSLYTDAKLPKPITKQQLRRMYIIGQILSKRISKERIQSMIQTQQLITPNMQQKIDAVIGNNAVLKEEITQLVNSDCGCENAETTEWGFPIICTALLVMMGIAFIPWMLLMVISMVPPSAVHEMIELLFLMLSPFLILWQLFDCRLPEGNNFPFISNVSPSYDEQNVLLNLTELRFRLTDKDGDLMSYKVTTNPYIGEGDGTLVQTGNYTVPIHGLQHSTRYTWKIYLWEGGPSGTPLAPNYKFTTAPIDPVISNPIPKNNTPYVPIYTSNVSFDLTDYQGDPMNWTVETQPDIGSGAGNGVGNGHYTIAINGLEYEKKYTWFLNVTDGTNWTRKTCVFTTTSEGLLVFKPSADTYVYLYHKDNNYGGSRIITVYNNNRSRGMVAFDLSEIPAGATIISANLSLYYYNYGLVNPIGREITCHRILEDWNEWTVTWNTQPASDPVECAGAIIPGYYTWINWNVTSEVNDFIYGGDTNNGWMLRDIDDYMTENINQNYYSKNAGNFRHPRLYVWYNPP